MGARMSVYDAAGNLKPYHYPYNVLHKMTQMPVRFFLAKCMFTRRVCCMALLSVYPVSYLNFTLRSKKNQETWAANRAHYDHRFFRPPTLPALSFESKKK